jgi:hypothetical protein
MTASILSSDVLKASVAHTRLVALYTRIWNKAPTKAAEALKTELCGLLDASAVRRCWRNAGNAGSLNLLYDLIHPRTADRSVARRIAEWQLWVPLLQEVASSCVVHFPSAQRDAADWAVQVDSGHYAPTHALLAQGYPLGP